MGLISSREGGGGFADSLLEQAGFEPSVRRDTINVSKCAHFGSACRNGKGGAKESRYHDDAWGSSAGLMVRIRFPPAVSQLRTGLSSTMVARTLARL
jgi:hypothetical protein